MTKKVTTSKKGSAQRAKRAGEFVEVRANLKGRSSVKFGSVRIFGSKPAAATVKANVDRSSEALERVGKKLASPGVVIREKKGVPLFSIVEDEPGIFVRRLNGQTDRGRLVNGQFQVLE